MRITVGGILFVAFLGAGGFFLLSPAAGGAGGLGKSIHQLREKISGTLGYSSAASTPTPMPFGQMTSSTEESPVSPVQTAPVAETAAAVETAPVAAEPEAAEIAAVEPKPVVKKKRTRRKKAATVSKPAAKPKTTKAPKAAAAPAAKKPAGGDDAGALIGQYVTLKLVTGNEVKGVLEEKTNSTYKVNLPGLGPFTYPVQNVQSVTPAK